MMPGKWLCVAVLMVSAPMLRSYDAHAVPRSPHPATRSPHPGGSQQNTSRHIAPGKCGPVDPTYLDIASETGGQPFFFSPSELGGSAHLMRETSRSDDAMVLWASDDLKNVRRDITIPIDSTIERVTFSASFDSASASLALFRPDGAIVAGTAGVEDSTFTCSRIVTVNAPRAGAWLARVDGPGRFWLVVHAKSDLDLIGVEFVRPGGRPGHEGLFRISGQPVADSPATLRVSVSDDEVRSRKFGWISSDGDNLNELDLPRTGDDEFTGAVPLPNRPFRFVMTGIDASGTPYQRVNAPVFHAESVEITAPASMDTLPAGQRSTVPFVVRNAGPAATFKLVAVQGGSLVSVDPPAVNIPQGGTATVRVVVSPPETGSSVDLTLTASTQSPRATTNSAIWRASVARER
jgi:von Willebrand factor A domain-containing protein 7